MIKDKKDIEIIAGSLGRLRGQLCWGVEWCRLTNLTVNFGSPRLKVVWEPRPRNSLAPILRKYSNTRGVIVRGRWMLSIHMGDWRIIRHKRTIATMSSHMKKKRKALWHLGGQRLVRVAVDRKRVTTRFMFDLDTTLEVRRMNGMSKDELRKDLWWFSEPDGHILSLTGEGELHRTPAQRERSKQRRESGVPKSV